jgi:hypothetical protein
MHLVRHNAQLHCGTEYVLRILIHRIGSAAEYYWFDVDDRHCGAWAASPTMVSQTTDQMHVLGTQQCCMFCTTMVTHTERHTERERVFRGTQPTQPIIQVALQLAIAMCQISLAEVYQTPTSASNADQARWATMSATLDQLFEFASVAEKYAKCDLVDEDGELQRALTAAKRLLHFLHLLLKHLCRQYVLTAEEQRRAKRTQRIHEQHQSISSAATTTAAAAAAAATTTTTAVLPSLHPTGDDDEQVLLSADAVRSLAVNIAPVLVTIIAGKWHYAIHILLSTMFQEQQMRGQPGEGDTVCGAFEAMESMCWHDDCLLTQWRWQHCVACRCITLKTLHRYACCV